jgi:hypothetical protein
LKDNFSCSNNYNFYNIDNVTTPIEWVKLQENVWQYQKGNNFYEIYTGCRVFHEPFEYYDANISGKVIWVVEKSMYAPAEIIDGIENSSVCQKSSFYKISVYDC